MKEYRPTCCDYCDCDEEHLKEPFIEVNNGETVTELCIDGSSLFLTIDAVPDDNGNKGVTPLMWKYYKANINFCPYCGRELQPEECKGWRITRAKGPMFHLLDINSDKVGVMKEQLIEASVAAGFSLSDAEAAFDEMAGDKTLTSITIINGDIYLSYA